MLTLRMQLLLLACVILQAAATFDAHSNRTFVLVNDLVCEIHSVIHYPKIVESYITKNKTVTFADCDETMTVTNAPTHVRTTVTRKETLEPCPHETCTDDLCHHETHTITETITPCDINRCTTKTLTYTITSVMQTCRLDDIRCSHLIAKPKPAHILQQLMDNPLVNLMEDAKGASTVKTDNAAQRIIIVERVLFFVAKDVTQS